MPCPTTFGSGLAAGFLRYITKPIDVASFMASVDVALDCAAERIAMISDAAIFDAAILIVDDQEANVQLLERMLRAAGYTGVTSTGFRGRFGPSTRKPL